MTLPCHNLSCDTNKCSLNGAAIIFFANAYQMALPYLLFRMQPRRRCRTSRFIDVALMTLTYSPSNTLHIPVNGCLFVESWTIYGWTLSTRVSVVFDNPTHVHAQYIHRSTKKMAQIEKSASNSILLCQVIFFYKDAHDK